MPTEPAPVTLAQVARRAVEVCDPSGADADLADLFERFEDADEPISAVGDIETRVAEAKGALDPEDEIPAVTMAAAVIVYLAHRRDEVSDDPEDILRLAARAEFDGAPPEHVQAWLDDRGVEV
jgi:hypothetical protein